MKAKEFTEQYDGGKGPGSDYRAYDEPNQRNNWVVKVDGKKWKVFSNQKSANRAAFTIQQKYGKKTEVYATLDPVSEAKSTAREKLVKDFEKIAGYKISDKEAWYQAVKDYYDGKRDTWPDPREFGLKESIELRHDLKPGVYKHKLQNIEVEIDDDGSVTFITPAEWEIEGDQEYLEYVESQLAMPEYWEAELGEASRPTKMRFPGERFSKELNTQDFELSSMYDHRSIDQLYQSLNVADNAIHKVTLKIEKLQDAGKRPVKTQQALEVLLRKRDYISDLIDQKEMQGKGVAEALTEEQFDEAAGEKDACYHKVKSRYKVWPSAYASGALVQCRKVGAKNWGNKSKKK